MSLVLVLVGSLPACTKKAESEEPRSLAQLGIDDGAGAGEEVSLLVETDKATTLELSTGAKVELLAGAVTRSQQMKLKRPADNVALPLVRTLRSGDKPSSAPYAFTPKSVTFDVRPTLTLPLVMGRDNAKITVKWVEDENDTDWKALGRPTITGLRAAIPLPHTGIFMLVEESDTAVIPSDDLATAINQSLQGCGLISADGTRPTWGFLENGDDDDENRCMVQCLLEAGCEAWQGVFCPADEDDRGDGYTLEDRCEDMCEGHTVYERVLCSDNFPAARCDGKDECLDGSDEDGCPPGLSFVCGDGTRIRINRQCDGGNDCADGTDESGCTAEDFFVCVDDYQIPLDSVCDGYSNCSDGADEMGCPDGTHFVCDDGGRISADGECDGYSECTDGSDEMGCPDGTHFVCDDGDLIRAEWECDAYDDCADGSDEADCAGRLFACADGSKNVRLEDVCDLEPNCEDGSDELGCATLTCPGAN